MVKGHVVECVAKCDSKLRAFSRSERGTSVIEMAFMLPIGISLIVGTIDVARAYSQKLKLEQVAQRSIEMVTATGLVGSNYAFVRAEAATASGLPVSQIVVENWLECNDVRQQSFDAVCPDGQAAARYVSLTMRDNYSPIFPVGFFAGSDGSASSITAINVDAQVRIQ